MISAFKVERTTFVPPQHLYDRLADAPRWREWATLVDVSELIQRGPVDPFGGGAIRRMGGLGGRLTVEEEILEAVSPCYQRYTARGLPVVDYLGEVRIGQDSGDTKIVWTGRFRPRLPGTGWILGRLLGYSIARIIDDAIAACQRAAAPDM
jgi:hypothetical protein